MPAPDGAGIPSKRGSALNNVRWRDPLEFPRSDGGWSVLHPIVGSRRLGESSVRKHLRRSLPTNPILLSSPDTGGRYLPPVLLEPAKLLRTAQRDARIMFWGTIGITLLGTALFYLGSDLRGATMFFTAYGILSAYTGFNAWLYQVDTKAISERWMFYGWCFSRGPRFALGFLLFMVLIGSIQLLGSGLFGDPELYKRSFGVIYADIDLATEWWRLLTAPLVHDSVSHWMANALIGTGLLTVYGPVLGLKGIFAALISTPAALLAVLLSVWAFQLSGFGIIGLSGGCAGLMGCFFAANLRRPASFPRAYALVTGFIAMVTLFVVSFFMSSGSFIAHLAGFSVGGLIGFLVNPFSPYFYVSEEGGNRAQRDPN